MQEIPFTPETQLDSQLVISSCETRLELTDSSAPSRLPDQPRIHLNTPELCDYIQQEIQTPELDGFTPYLWLLSTPSHTNVSPLHHQLVKGRTIILTEDPQLHLLWIYNHIFIKPIPAYLLSHAFWKFYLTNEKSPLTLESRQKTFAAARGFLRTYAYLIRYKSDFEIAKRENCRLLPEHVGWTAFIDFISGFSELGNDHVCPRYRFGQIRLNRLKLWSRVFFYRFSFEKFYGQYGEYFGQFYAPILFVFGVFSVVLSAMQVELAVSTTVIGAGSTWIPFDRAARWFSVATIVGVAGMAAFFLFMLLRMVVGEILYTCATIYRKRTERKLHKAG